MRSNSATKFLSHLCGEEVDLDAGTLTLNFLSHLCGEEETLILISVEP